MTDPSSDGVKLPHPAILIDAADEDKVVKVVEVMVPVETELLDVTEVAEPLVMVEVG